MQLPPASYFTTVCSMAAADGARRQIVGLIPDRDGAYTVWTPIDSHGVRHDVPLMDDAVGNYPGGDKQAFRVALAVIATAEQPEPCCC